MGVAVNNKKVEPVEYAKKMTPEKPKEMQKPLKLEESVKWEKV